MEIHAEKVAIIAHFATNCCDVINRYFRAYSYTT